MPMSSRPLTVKSDTKSSRRCEPVFGVDSGSLMMFTKAAMDDSGEFQAKIKSFTALGPVARMAHMDSPLR
jgi:hypothetical protein